MRKIVTLSLVLGCLVSGCAPTQQRPPPRPLTTDELLAFANAILDCELRAANRFDDGHREISELAQQVMGVCTVERFRFRQALHGPLNDPEADLDEYKGAVNAVEMARNGRSSR
jgi:hypothetical protein